jgi:hypothetical protein
MAKFECEREDIPTKWTVLDLIPGPDDEWILLFSSGVKDPAGAEMVMNAPTPEFRGNFETASLAMDKKIKELKVMGYKQIQKQNNDELPQP